MKKRFFLKSTFFIATLLTPFYSTLALPPPTGTAPTHPYTPSQGAPTSQGNLPAQGAPGQPTSPTATPKPPVNLPKKVEKSYTPKEKGGAGIGFYTAPGVIAIKENGWVGSDNLYNLTDRIGISVEILKPASMTLTVTDETLRNIVAEVMQRANLRPELNPAQSSSPLPFFHVLVMLYPHEGALAIFCEGRLFENIKLDRVVTDKSTLLQGITWEKQSLVIVPLFDANAQVGRAIANLTNAFVERFTYFEHLKTQNRF